MKIKNKLTLTFTFVVAVILLCLNVYIYIISKANARNDFYAQLRERAIVTATVFLEADEQSSSVISVYQKKYLRTLPGEIVRVFNANNVAVFTDTTEAFKLDASFINSVKEKKEFRQQKDDRQTLGIYYEDNEGNFVIVASAIDTQGIIRLKQLKNVLIIGFIISIVVLFFVGRYFTKLMLKPISDISSQASKISETNLHLRLNEGNKKDELAELSMMINHMLERLESAFDLQKSFIANASHELRTPLTSIIGNAEVTLSKSRPPEEYRVVLEQVAEEADKLRNLTNGLLNLAQSNVDFSNLHKEEIRIDELLLEIKDEMKTKRPGSSVDVVFPEMPSDPASLIIYGNHNLLETALLNLVDNACKFSDGKKVTLALSVSDAGLSVTITDQGIGISGQELPHITETFYRAGNARSYVGSGIGLSLAQKIITLHHGTLHIDSKEHKGTTVTVTFEKKDTF